MRVAGALGVVLFAAVAAVGCMFIDDFSKFEIARDASVAPDAQGGPDAESDGTVDARIPDLACVDDVLSGIPLEVVVDTAGFGDDHEGTCGGGGAPDVAYQWTAPRDDFYRFHTSDSEIETVLYLRDGDCDAEELACSNEQGGPYRSEIVQWAEEGRRLVAVVDGSSGDVGEATLHIDAVGCPGIQLTDAILPVQQSTDGRPPYDGATCVSAEHGARTYRFTAPENGTYSFLAVRETGPGFRPALIVEEGPICGGEWLQCSTGDDGRAEVRRHLTEGEHLTLIVAGSTADGPFRLQAERVGEEPCVDLETGQEGGFGDEPVTGELPQDGPHRMTTSCGPASVWDGDQTDPERVRSLPDINVRIAALGSPDDSCHVCDVDVTAHFSFFAAISDLDDEGVCAWRERTCRAGEVVEEGSEDNPPVVHRSLGVPADGKPKLLTIERQLSPDWNGTIIDYSEPHFEIQLSCLISHPC